MAAAASSSSAGAGADTELYSRQLYVMGHAAQARMAASDILIVGLRGVGVEIAKNLILMGVKGVSLCDPEPAAWVDLAANFYLSESDVARGTPRASACLAPLAALNPYVKVSLLTGDITPEVVARFAVVVAADLPIHAAVALNKLVRGAGGKFVAAEARGVFSRLFCDFGASHTVEDTTGEPPRTCMVASVTCDAPGLVTVTDDARHGLEDGDVVVFSEVAGMPQLNGGVGRPIKSVGPYTFTIEDTRGYAPYVRGGWVTQVKQPRTITSFKPLSALVGPVGGAGGPDGPYGSELLVTDFAKADTVAAVHAGFAALHAFARERAGAFPTPGNPAEEDAVIAAAAAVATAASAGGGMAPTASAESTALLRQMVRCAGGSLSPMASALGGIAAQEALKAVSGKFTPVTGWLYFDAREALPPGDAPLPGGGAGGDFAPCSSRYDGQTAVFGRAFQAKLGALKYFLVGAGAIGCEVLKCWAGMGVGAGEGGHVTLTDMDRIEKSNLSRQFLFRAADIGAAKSTTAVAAARAMNPSLRATAYETRVGPDTESVFSDGFWEGLDGVCTALDNVDARLYVDSRAVYYGRPLLESGTLGTKGNTQVVVPRMTENYGASRDPPEASIPVCTLKNFPNKIEHTLQVRGVAAAAQSHIPDRKDRAAWFDATHRSPTFAPPPPPLSSGPATGSRASSDRCPTPPTRTSPSPTSWSRWRASRTRASTRWSACWARW